MFLLVLETKKNIRFSIIQDRCVLCINVYFTGMILVNFNEITK